jgi:hypothetical protein
MIEVAKENRLIGVRTFGRRMTEDFWVKSGILKYESLVHNPILAFVSDGGQVQVQVHECPLDVCYLPDDTPIMAQWPGKWRSDWFQGTAGDLKKAMEDAGFKSAALRTDFRGAQMR